MLYSISMLESAETMLWEYFHQVRLSNMALKLKGLVPYVQNSEGNFCKLAGKPVL